MALDGKLLRRAREKLAAQKAANEAAQAQRQATAYAANPRIRALDQAIQDTVRQAIALALHDHADPQTAIAQLERKNLSLQSELRQELLLAGLPADYLDAKPLCPLCSDTGYQGTQLCTCLKTLYQEEQTKELSSLLKLGEETFDTFSLSWYDSRPDPDTGISPRQAMEFVYDSCVEYARKFGPHSLNLFLCGGTGLGKTFLSTCIAKVVADLGFSVVYDTAFQVFQTFEAEKFAKPTDDPTAIQNELHRYLTCDLLIMDDLGTELTTAFVSSALYRLINTRLVTGKKTIINSNLTLSEIPYRYTPQIASRLAGEYQVLQFYGSDIRLLKKDL